MPRQIDSREFVVTWMRSSSADEVAKAMSMASAASVNAKATALRKRGVKLPKLEGFRGGG